VELIIKYSLERGLDLNEERRERNSTGFMIFYVIMKINTQLKIRPLSVINFFKYLASRNIRSFHEYMDDLKTANNYLAEDRSVPKWSIYHGLIPLTLATELLESVADRERQASDAGIRVDRDEFRRPLKGRIRFTPRSLSTPI